MENVLGIDLGTNSIGLSLRNLNEGGNLKGQLSFFSTVIFPSGVGKGKTGEFSYAAERTKHRSSRRLYQSRRYKLWRTLEVLIKNEYCPLSIDDLDKWRCYDKSKGLKRQYPIDAAEFESWIRLDFNGDGKADYTSPFQLRAELVKEQLDFNNKMDRYKLGRALYHIAQHRGFKSSKGEKMQDQEKAEVDYIIEEEINVADELKKSEEKKSKDLVSYMKENNLSTVGCAFAHLENSGIRVRASQYQAVRSQNKEEIKKIFEFQKMPLDSDFCKQILSEKKSEGSIFYKRPLRSQKGNVGKCTLEPNKYRCPISHPEFERFRAWSFINNISYRKSIDDEFVNLTLEQKDRLYKEKFLRVKTCFEFADIRKWIESEISDGIRKYELSYSEKIAERTINYNDKTNVSGCPISARLKNLLGDDWESWTFVSGKERTNKKNGVVHEIIYDALDLWHICFSYDELEAVSNFAKNQLDFDEKQAKGLMAISGAIQQGYSMLSLKAIRNINRFLCKGLIYTESVLLAKLPDIFKEKWEENEEYISDSIDEIIALNRKQKQLYIIANALIANYKSLEYNDELNYNEKFAEHDYEYKLQSSDLEDVENAIINNIGKQSWQNNHTEEERKEIKDAVADLYQNFFYSSSRDYYKMPRLSEAMSVFLSKHFSFLNENDLKKIYHPSMIEFYPPAKDQLIDGRSIKLLGSPVIGAIKNPMAMRVLHTLRRQINNLIKDNMINPEETRIVVETAREINDANMRWAIKKYQDEREEENKEYRKIIEQYFPQRNITDEDIDKVRLLIDQHDILRKGEEVQAKTVKNKATDNFYKKDITKYRLWLEQGCRCIYTGKIIGIKDLFSENQIDIEHTIPRSISFDNSLSNLTVCDAHFNRTIKKNRMPSQLENYDEILGRIQPWIDNVEQLKNNIESWKGQSKRAQDKDRKDYCIRKRHMLKMELDYWKKKVEAFTAKEYKGSFRNNQLNDTRLIVKYAYHYLRTVFNSVDVQNGHYTADFRKILGIQSIDEKKDRNKHSHHAIDATVLTLIPPAAKRDKMIKLFYEIEEEKKLGKDISGKQKELQRYLKSCGFGSIKGVDEYIEENIMVNHISTDRTLKPAKRMARKRGKIVKINNKTVWIDGDSIRGQLHKDSYFGAIKTPLYNDDGKLIRNNGVPEYETDAHGNGVISMVIRIPIDSFKDEKELNKIIDPSIRNSILQAVKRYRKEDDKLSFEQAIKKPIYRLDSNGIEIKHNKQGKTICPIRHVRCKVAAGRGFLTKEKALEIKEHVYKSSKTYKQFVYAQNDGNYLCLLYEGMDSKGKIIREFDFLSYFDVAKLELKDPNDLFKEPYYRERTVKKTTLKLKSIIKNGTRVLFWKDSPDEIKDLENSELSKRFYIVYKFNSTSSNHVYLRNHLISVTNGKDATEFNDMIIQPLLNVVASNFNCLIENVDFRIFENGKIIFNHD